MTGSVFVPSFRLFEGHISYMLQFAQLLANKCLQNFGEKLYIFENNKRNCLVDKIVMWGHSLGTSIAVTEGEHLT